MGLTCSVLGHAFEAAELEREREEQGSEAVTVVREVETCRRCGERRVVSENKEVTAIVDPDDVGIDAEAPEPDAEAPSPDRPATPDDGSGEPAHVGATADPGEALDPEPDAEATGFTDDDFEPPTDPAEDDAEILEDSREEPRTPGQWPEDDGGFEPASLTGGPAEGEEMVEDSEAPADASSSRTRSADADGEGSPEPDMEPAATASSVARGDYVCPACGFSTPAESSSLRAGDACPQCQQGYLESR